MYHNITLVGRLGGDPEMKYLADATAVTNFSVAVDDGYGENKRAVWFRVAAWRKTAEAVNQYLSKGDAVLVRGRLNVDPETGGPRVFQRKDGTPGASYEVTADEVKFMPRQSPVESAQVHAVEDDEVPF